MKLIIPMSGQGSRFAKAGYTVLKPLIKVEGRPIIEHVLNMFPGVEDVVFVCNQEHLAETGMKNVLLSLRPDATIAPIVPHKKGPVYAVARVYDCIRDDEEIIISYCDFAQDWDFEQFRRDQERLQFAGAVPAYTGFHPHLLHRNLYAGVQIDKSSMMTDIQEKHSFTDDPQNSHHSSGVYYFASGALLKYYFKKLIDSGETINDEYYVSMVYPHLLRDGLKIFVPPIKRFMQWGTPEDLEEYEAWSSKIHADLGKSKSATDIPSERKRFVKIPYQTTTTEFKDCYQYWHRRQSS